MASGVKIWDLPTRLFHWLLVLLFSFSWWSAETGEMDWHRFSGTVLLGLLLFRLLWGFVGGSTARFSSFVRSPAVVLGYLRGAASPRPGHNPLGALSVLALLLALAVQITSGLFATDTDGLESGPLSFLISFDASRTVAEIHETSFKLFLALVALHVATILLYLVRRRNLIAPMISGRDSQTGFSLDGLKPAPRFAFLISAAFAALFAWAASKGFWL
jgi:cytochrome b